MSKATPKLSLFLATLLCSNGLLAIELERGTTSLGEISIYSESATAPIYWVITGEAATEIRNLTSNSETSDVPEQSDANFVVSAFWRSHHLCFTRSARKGLEMSHTCILRSDRSGALLEMPKRNQIIADAQIGYIASAGAAVTNIKSMINSQKFFEITVGAPVADKFAELINGPEKEVTIMYNQKRLAKYSRHLLFTRRSPQDTYVAFAHLNVDGLPLRSDAKFSNDAFHPVNMELEQIYHMPGMRDAAIEVLKPNGVYYVAKSPLTLTPALDKSAMKIPTQTAEAMGGEKMQACFIMSSLEQNQISPKQIFWLEEVVGTLKQEKDTSKIYVRALFYEVSDIRPNGRPILKKYGIPLEYICIIDSSFFDRDKRPNYVPAFYWYDLLQVFDTVSVKK